MYKFLFSILVSPLGLPIDWFYECIILLVVGEIAYRIAFITVGDLIVEGLIPNKNSAKRVHWIIRLITYVIIWAFLRLIIGFFV